MRLIRSVILLASVAASASAQATTRPTTAQAGTAVRTAGADLVIDSLDLVLLPRPIGSVGLEGEGVKVTGLVMVARVTNRGTERWAAPRGMIGFVLSAGRDEDTPARRGPAGGVSVVPGQPSSVIGRAAMAPFGPFNGNAPIPGSLAPGESRVITFIVKNRAERAFLIFERDKYYTLTATLRGQGDMNPANDRSRRVGRFDAGRDRLVAQWEPLAVLSLPRGGSVEVAPPPRRP